MKKDTRGEEEEEGKQKDNWEDKENGSSKKEKEKEDTKNDDFSIWCPLPWCHLASRV